MGCHVASLIFVRTRIILALLFLWLVVAKVCPILLSILIGVLLLSRVRLGSCDMECDNCLQAISCLKCVHMQGARHQSTLIFRSAWRILQCCPNDLPRLSRLATSAAALQPLPAHLSFRLAWLQSCFTHLGLTSGPSDPYEQKSGTGHSCCIFPCQLVPLANLRKRSLSLMISPTLGPLVKCSDHTAAFLLRLACCAT